MPDPPFPQGEEVSPSNPFLEEEEASRRDARPLERALDMLMVTTSRRCPRESDSVSGLHLDFVERQYLSLINLLKTKPFAVLKHFLLSCFKFFL